MYLTQTKVGVLLRGQSSRIITKSLLEEKQRRTLVSCNYL